MKVPTWMASAFVFFAFFLGMGATETDVPYKHLARALVVVLPAVLVMTTIVVFVLLAVSDIKKSSRDQLPYLGIAFLVVVVALIVMVGIQAQHPNKGANLVRLAHSNLQTVHVAIAFDIMVGFVLTMILMSAGTFGQGASAWRPRRASSLPQGIGDSFGYMPPLPAYASGVRAPTARKKGWLRRRK